MLCIIYYVLCTLTINDETTKWRRRILDLLQSKKYWTENAIEDRRYLK